MTRLSRALVVAGLAAATTFTMPAAALAGTGQCTDGKACVWKDNTYSGRFRGMANDANDYKNITWNGVGWDIYINEASPYKAHVSSVRSQGVNCKLRFYDKAEGDGDWIHFNRVLDGSNYQDPYLANGGGTGAYSSENWDNRIRSHRFVHCPTS